MKQYLIGDVFNLSFCTLVYFPFLVLSVYCDVPPFTKAEIFVLSLSPVLSPIIMQKTMTLYKNIKKNNS